MRVAIKFLVNDSDKDFVDKYDGDEYVVPAHGELPVPDYIAHHFCGNPEIAGDGQRALERRGMGGGKAIGLPIYIKPEETPIDEEYIVDNNKPVVRVKSTRTRASRSTTSKAKSEKTE